MTRRGESLTSAAQRGIRWSAVNTFGSAGLQLVQVAVLARLLKPADFGQMAIIIAMLGIGTTFAEMGLSSALIQRRDPRRGEIATLYSVNMIAGATMFLVVWIAAPLLEHFYRMPGLARLARTAAAVFVVAPLGQIFRAQLQKALDFRSLAQINLASLAVGTGVSVVLATRGAGIWALVIGYLVGEFLAAAGLIVSGVRRGYWVGVGWDLPGIRGYLAFGGLRVIAMMANAINSRIDQLVVGRIMGAVPLGLYSVAQRIALEPVQRINPIVTQVAFPVLATVQHERDRMQRGCLRMIAAVMAVNAPLLLGLAATAPLVVLVVLGPQWRDAGLTLRILAGYALFRSAANAAGSVVMAAGRADFSVYWNVALLFVLPTVVLVCARAGGSVNTVAAGLAVTQVVLVWIHYAVFVRRIIGPCGRAYAFAILRPTVLAGVMATLVVLVEPSLDRLAPLVQLVILAALGAVVYVASSLLWQKEVAVELAQLLRIRRLPGQHGEGRV
jgi:lipopolysaccharide exporter